MATETRGGIFSGDDPLALARAWMAEAARSELNDPDAMALATVDADGLPNVRIVLLKEIEADGLVFFTNYNSAKGRELTGAGLAATVLHWKSLRRQVRARGIVERLAAHRSDAYFATRALRQPAGRLGLGAIAAPCLAGRIAGSPGTLPRRTGRGAATALALGRVSPDPDGDGILGRWRQPPARQVPLAADARRCDMGSPTPEPLTLRYARMTVWRAIASCLYESRLTRFPSLYIRHSDGVHFK